MSDEELMGAGLKRQQLPLLLKKDLFTHKDQASWSINSEFEILYNADHYVQFEQPEIVVKAVISVVEKVRLNDASD